MDRRPGLLDVLVERLGAAVKAREGAGLLGVLDPEVEAFGLPLAAEGPRAQVAGLTPTDVVTADTVAVHTHRRAACVASWLLTASCASCGGWP